VRYKIVQSLTRTQWLVLNATADDFEDLERIYRSLSLEFSPGKYDPSDPSSFYWREAKDCVPLAEIADCVRDLVDRGLLSVKLQDECGTSYTRTDPSYVWRGWFQMTPYARTLVESWSEAGHGAGE
jgi:hypothetical protein